MPSKADGEGLTTSSVDESTYSSLEHGAAASETIVIELGGKALNVDVGGEAAYDETVE